MKQKACKKHSENYITKIVGSCLSVIFWVVIWQIAANAIGKELILPTPLSVGKHLIVLVRTGRFWKITATSVLRVLGGYALGFIAGIVLAPAAAGNRIAAVLISTPVRVLRSTPVASFVILVMLFSKYTYVPVIISSIMVFPIIYQNVKTGIEKTDAGLKEVATVFRFGLVKKIRLLYFPSVRPYLMSAAVTALGLAWKSAIAAEVLCLPNRAIGSEIFYSKNYLETPDLFAWTLVVIVLGLIFEKLLEKTAIAEKAKQGGDKQ